MGISDNIKAIREKNGITQAQLAKDLFISQQMLGAIETGIRQPSLNIALAIANYFKTTVEALAYASGAEQMDELV